MSIQEIFIKLWTGFPITKEFIDTNYPAFIQTIGGLKLTLIIAFLSILLSIIPGCLIGVVNLKLKAYKTHSIYSLILNAPLWIIKGVVELIRGIPLIVLVMLVYTLPYPLLGVRLPVALRGVLAMTIYSSVYMGALFYAGFQAVDRSLIDTAKTLGLKWYHTLFRIQFPIALRVMLPSFINLVITVFKDSSILSVVGVCELTFTASQITASQPTHYFVVLLMVIFLYFIIAFITSLLSKFLEKKLVLNYNN